MSAARAERPAKKERNVRIRSLFPWVLLLASCAATEEQAAVPVPVVAPAPVAACLTFVIQDERPAAEDEYQRRIRADVRDAFEQELTRAGFTVVYNESYPHDVVARLSTAPGSAVSEGSQVESVLALEGDSGRFAELRAHTAQSSRTYAYEVARGLVDRVFQAPEVASFARELRRPNVERVEARLVAEHQAAVSRALESDPAPSPTPVAPVATTTPAPATPPAELPFLVGPKDPSAYAIVIGIDTYADGRVVPGARKDAERFVRMARDTLGVPEKQISLAVGERARRADMDALVSWMKLGAPMGSRVYVYFAGLGTSRQSGPMFLLPYDGNADTMEKSGVRLSKLLFSLSDTKAREVITFIDAGSAGVGARSVAPKGATTPVRARDEEVPPRVVLFLGASHGDATLTTEGGASGLFSRYLFEGLGRGNADLDGDGQVTFAELTGWVKPRVARDAKKANATQGPWFDGGPGATPGSRLVLAKELPTL
jgi:hypothetical protein